MRRAFSIDQVTADPLRDRATEFVERKGIGHPDSICDGVAEAVSRALSQYYLENFDRILHHNTDKVHLGAGQAEPRYGGGDVLEPIYVLVGGRATKRFDDHPIPVGELARKAARDYILDTFDELDSSMIEIEARIGESSTDLRDLFDRDSIPRANDTSFGVGHAPLSTAEHTA